MPTLVDVLAEKREKNKVVYSHPLTEVREFKSIKEKFQKAMENNVPILLENSDLNLTQSVVLLLDYVGERWCKGYVTYIRDFQRVRVPYTISYADLYTKNDAQSKSKNVNVIFKGASPYHG